MYQKDAEILYPFRVTPRLRNLRGPEWRDKIDEIVACEENSVDALAFSYLMLKVAGCLSCHSDSYRAMQGCTSCAVQTILRHKSSDQELLRELDDAQQEVAQFVNNQ